LRGESEPVEIGDLNRFDRPQPALASYDQLWANWPEGVVLQ
jgi:hypothetical protein